MNNASAVATLTTLSRSTLGVFRGNAAVVLGVTRKQIGALVAAGVVERLHPDTYRMSVVAASNEQALRAALMWAGTTAVATGCSAGETYELDGVRAAVPEIIGSSVLRARGGQSHRAPERRSRGNDDPSPSRHPGDGRRADARFTGEHARRRSTRSRLRGRTPPAADLGAGLTRISNGSE